MVTTHITIAAFSDLSHDQRLRRISQSLTENGFEVKLLGRLFPKSVDLPTEKYTQERLSYRFAKGKFAYLEFNIRLIFNLMPVKTDAICSVDLDTLPACWLVAKIRNKKLIHDAHEYMEEVPEVYNRPVTKIIWNLVARTFLPGVDLAYTVSQSLVDEFRLRYGKAFQLVRNMPVRNKGGVPVPASPFGSGYWVFLGAINKGRGLEQFLEVLPATNRKLVILGTGDLLPVIQQLVSDKMLDHMVVFAGKQTPEQMMPILCHAWAGINLLTDEGLSYRYSLANKFFDYVQAGIPQICIAFPEYARLNSEHEVAVLTRLETRSLQAATELISNPIKRQVLLENCQSAGADWNWQKEEKELIRLYQTSTGK